MGDSGIRLLGYLQTEPDGGKPEAVYEYFSSLGAEQEWLRAVSKADFEEGIRCLREGRFREGRRLFAQVLQVNRDDLAAGYYFRICDEGMEGKGDLISPYCFVLHKERDAAITERNVL